jgi:ABC-type Fe3+-hydroxamate transport system substrate-binding protein
MALMSNGITDATGKVYVAQRPSARAVSLVPSLTEAIFALGAGERLVGVTKYCVEPAGIVDGITRVGGTKNPDVGAIVALAPDLVVASAEENREEDVAALRAAGIDVLVTLYQTVEAAIDGMADLAAVLDVSSGLDWLHDGREERERLLARSLPPVPYFCPIWRRPYMAARDDTYMADLLRSAGGINALGGGGAAHYNDVDLTELHRANPSVILLPDEPYPFAEKHLKDFEPFVDIDAVRHGRILLVDGKALTWYGPRMAGALRMFAGLFDGARHEDAASVRPPGRAQ